jgi:antirestriction protein ArdC
MNQEVLSATETRFDVYRTITDKIIVAMETGADPFVLPWHGAGGCISRPVNAATHALYRGINVVALWAESALRGYGSGAWASYRQWQHLGAQVRKGEHGAVIVFFKEVEREDFGVPNGEVDRPRLIARASRVFNAEQVDNWQPPGIELPSRVGVLAEVEAFVAATKADIQRGGTIACYRHVGDCIQMPDPALFTGSATRTPTEAYYAVLLHELVHFSGAKHRLDRQFGERFGDAAYAAEELVAELGAAFLCADLKIGNELRADHASYIQAWLKILQNDRKAIFFAASRASQAVDYLHDLVKAIH